MRQILVLSDCNRSSARFFWYTSLINSTMGDVNFSLIICDHCTLIDVTFENITWTNASLRNSYFRHCHRKFSQ